MNVKERIEQHLGELPGCLIFDVTTVEPEKVYYDAWEVIDVEALNQTDEEILALELKEAILARDPAWRDWGIAYQEGK